MVRYLLTILILTTTNIRSNFGSIRILDILVRETIELIGGKSAQAEIDFEEGKEEEVQEVIFE